MQSAAATAVVASVAQTIMNGVKSRVGEGRQVMAPYPGNRCANSKTHDPCRFRLCGSGIAVRFERAPLSKSLTFRLMARSFFESRPSAIISPSRTESRDVGFRQLAGVGFLWDTFTTPVVFDGPGLPDSDLLSAIHASFPRVGLDGSLPIRMCGTLRNSATHRTNKDL